MPPYTFIIEGDDLTTGKVEERLLENDAAAAQVAARLLGSGHVAVSVGRGAEDEIEWLGAWDWCEGQPRWTPEE